MHGLTQYLPFCADAMLGRPHSARPDTSKNSRPNMDRREDDFFAPAKETSFFDEGRRRSGEFDRAQSPMRQPASSSQDKFFADGRARSGGVDSVGTFQDRPKAFDGGKAFLESGRAPAAGSYGGGSSNAFFGGSSKDAADARARSFLDSGR